MAAALAAGASDYVMPDLERIGGVTGWQRAAGLAMAAGVEMSSHLFPEVSAHLIDDIGLMRLSGLRHGIGSVGEWLVQHGFASKGSRSLRGRRKGTRDDRP